MIWFWVCPAWQRQKVRNFYVSFLFLSLPPGLKLSVRNSINHTIKHLWPEIEYVWPDIKYISPGIALRHFTLQQPDISFHPGISPHSSLTFHPGISPHSYLTFHLTVLPSKSFSWEPSSLHIDPFTPHSAVRRGGRVLINKPLPSSGPGRNMDHQSNHTILGMLPLIHQHETELYGLLRPDCEHTHEHTVRQHWDSCSLLSIAMSYTNKWRASV